ncbi:MAG: HsdR family type I site-specific deoxyribonuclease [Acidimicrobiales bacterium]|nr:HsdR family type I site-specific deoxyribonuclease [Acidimicrobiales bacterium]MYB80547.1 HsdR family type I site-specific deoxyribonuclease [Acidimicrobiales bacterium]MYI12851.1 HsdR family type I site-specific deoxyribonuclease [Acidimicrobiales bacterium]
MSPSDLTEDALVEQPAMQLLSQLGWQVSSGFDEALGPAGTLGRDSQSKPVLGHRLRDALRALNPGLPESALGDAIDQLVQDRSVMDDVRANREVYELLREGAKVEVTGSDSSLHATTVRFIDWSHTDANDWLAVSQFWIAGDMYKRRADIVLFVNGIPFVLIELKVSHKNVRNAYDDNLRDYRDTVPHLFWFNAFVVLSNGADTRIGSTSASWGHFAEWKRINSEGEQGIVSLETALRGTCDPYRLLDLVENFIAYTERPGGLVKALAKNHQYLGVNNSLEALRELQQREGRLGVFWHTQGSGKSLSMLWFTQKVLRREPGNWTFVLVTDRKELDEQLYETFADSGVITAGQRVHADNSARLRELLGQDHRYVFTLIHKFIPPEMGQPMPVLSERDDIIVITDEAHRTQYDTLAANMRLALPNASYLGFTGTPLIVGEEETRRVFGDYVSIYNFRDSIDDGATVPLYYENRTPELQLTNDDFDEELEDLLEAAELDEAQERAVARRFGQQYELITRPNRLEEVAADLVRHFVNRGFRGKAMYVAIDKATAVRMFDLVEVEWARYLAELEAELADTPELERPHLESRIDFMRGTDMAVVVSQAQNEVADMADAGLDIAKHRKRMVDEDLDSKFKDPEDPFRLVFVCAMWLTGFDSPSTSTVYLDKPMRNHVLMQTIARANRVFPNKDNGLIVDYVGVFRNLERALAIYAAGRAGPESGVDSPIRPKDELIAELEAALSDTVDFCDAHDVDLHDLDSAQGFEFIALQKAAVEALLVDEQTRRQYVALARRVRSTFKALLPDPEAIEVTHRVAVIRSIASKIESMSEAPDISGVMSSVSDLLDRSVGAKEYIIRSAGGADPLLDLSALDFDQLAFHFAANKRTAAKAIEKDLEKRLDDATRKNPMRLDLAERFRRLIDEYNAGTHNLEEFLRRLKAINDELTEEEQRAVREDLSEAELAIYDLLTKPEPELTESEARRVKGAARKLLQHVEDKLVLDWKKQQQTRSAVRVAISEVLDEELPEVYGPELFDTKVGSVFDHISASYFNDGGSVYEATEAEARSATAVAALPDAAEDVSDELLAMAAANPDLRARLMEVLLGTDATWACATEELLGGETREVEYKQTARWNVREQRKDRAMEDVIVKTVAGMLNDHGGTLLIGVTDGGDPVGLDDDYALVKPPNADGFVNWLDTLFENSLGHAGANRLTIRMDQVEGHDICRIDIPASHRPIWVKNPQGVDTLYQRRNNSTRAVPNAEIESFLTDRFRDS